jgi:hypothetical protein
MQRLRSHMSYEMQLEYREKARVAGFVDTAGATNTNSSILVLNLAANSAHNNPLNDEPTMLILSICTFSKNSSKNSIKKSIV